MAKRKKIIIRVRNSPDGKAFTSLRSAKGLVERRRAAWVGPSEIEILSEVLQQQLEQKYRDELWESEVRLGIIRKGAAWWNGSDRNPLARHRPGEVRS